MAIASRRKVIISGMLGNGLEWYDYALYGQMSLIFSKLFFHSSDPALGLILTYLTFAVGFIARPLGAVLFGRIGDKYGRKKALTASMILMAIPTGAIGLLPTYDMVGALAPILLLIIRILQGLSLGGAFSGSMSYVVEHADADKRAVTGSVTMLSLVVGFLFGSLVSSIIASVLGDDVFATWGWRLPFLFGVLIGFVGFWIRNHGDESPVYQQAKDSGALSQSPVKEAFASQPGKMLQGFAFYLFVTIPFYLLAIYMIGYSSKYLGLTQSQALTVNAMSMIAMFIPIYPAAALADRFGRRPVMMAIIVAMLALVYPAFLSMQTHEYHSIMIAQLAMTFLLGAYIAPIPALLVELFPTRIRYTGMALSYNFCAILGGLTPAIAEAMIQKTGNPTCIMWLIVAAAFASLLALWLYKDRYKEPLA